jgi:hypothetical protein
LIVTNRKNKMNKEIWDDQLLFNEQFFKDQGLDLKSLSVSEKIKWAKEFFFHINNELTDLVNCFPRWKIHYKNNEREEELILSNLKEEYIDVFKYLLGLGQTIGLSYDDIVNTYKEKTEVVKQKYSQNKKIEELRNKKIIIFDIDGVINDYPQCFVDWVNSTKSTKYESLENMKSVLDQKSYEGIKIEYRLSGAKRFQPINEDTVKTMKMLHEKGEAIVLFTNRPVSTYKVLYSDTLFWLNSNNIPFEAIYWSDCQAKEDIYKLNFDIKFIVEDNLSNAKQFNHQGHLVFLLDKDNNKDSYKSSLLVRINKAGDIMNYYNLGE